MVWAGICRDCRLAIDPDTETTVMEPCSSSLGDITKGIENITLVSQYKYLYSYLSIMIMLKALTKIVVVLGHYPGLFCKFRTHSIDVSRASRDSIWDG